MKNLIRKLFGRPNVERLERKKDVAGLIKVLENEKNETFHRRWAAEALGEIKDLRAVKPLVDALQIGNKYLRGPAAFALVKIGGAPKGADREIVRWVEEDESWGCGRTNELITHVLRAMKDAPTDVRKAMARALMWSSYELLVASLKDPETSVREMAAMALGERGDSKALAPLSTALRHDVYREVREAAAEALGRIKDPGSVEPLTHASGDGETCVREAAKRALDGIRAAEALKEKAEIWKKKKESLNKSMKFGYGIAFVALVFYATSFGGGYVQYVYDYPKIFFSVLLVLPVLTAFFADSESYELVSTACIIFTVTVAAFGVKCAPYFAIYPYFIPVNALVLISCTLLSMKENRPEHHIDLVSLMVCYWPVMVASLLAVWAAHRWNVVGNPWLILFAYLPVLYVAGAYVLWKWCDDKDSKIQDGVSMGYSLITACSCLTAGYFLLPKLNIHFYWPAVFAAGFLACCGIHFLVRRILLLDGGGIENFLLYQSSKTIISDGDYADCSHVLRITAGVLSVWQLYFAYVLVPKLTMPFFLLMLSGIVCVIVFGAVFKKLGDSHAESEYKRGRQMDTSHEWRSHGSSRGYSANVSDVYEHYHGRGSWYDSIEEGRVFIVRVGYLVAIVAVGFVFSYSLGWAFEVKQYVAYVLVCGMTALLAHKHIMR